MKSYNFITIFFCALYIFSCSNEESSSFTEADTNMETQGDYVEEPKRPASWEEFGTVDEFGKETGNTTIASEFSGTMSNSATTNSPLKAIAQLVDGQIYMRFLEYGRHPADMPHSKFMYIAVRRPNGDVEYVGQFLWDGYMTDGGYLPGSDPNFSLPEWRDLPTYGDGESQDNQLLDILLEETEPITVRVEMSWVDRSNSAVYVFDMDNYGLAELLNRN